VCVCAHGSMHLSSTREQDNSHNTEPQKTFGASNALFIVPNACASYNRPNIGPATTSTV
jgi:hypothetical protein